MTIGPEPMTSTDEMSVLRGTAGLLARGHQVGEPVEQVSRVVRAGRGLGVVLHREGGDVEAAQPLRDAVVEADVAYLGGTERRLEPAAVLGPLDGEPVVVRRHLDLAGGAVEHRKVDPAVAVAELERGQ